MTFRKRIGRDLVMTFKPREGQCTATISGQQAKQDCRDGLRNFGESVVEQAATLFLSYQLQDVVQTLMTRPLTTSETDVNRLESLDTRDSYVLKLADESLPADLVYKIGDSDSPIQVQYSNYLKLAKGRFPGKTAIGRLNNPPIYVFTVNNVRVSARGK